MERNQETPSSLEKSNKVNHFKYALKEGDVLSPSNAGDLKAVNEEIPNDFVTVSFSVPLKML